MDHKTVTNMPARRRPIDRGYPVILLLFVVSLFFFPTAANGKMGKQGSGSSVHKMASGTAGEKKPQPLPINRPVQITFRTDPVLYAAASVDGDWLLYVSEKQGLPELWLRSADPSKGGPPEKLSHGEVKLWEPAVSRDGSLIAFAGASHDAKGDIFLINRNSLDLSPQRLTGRETAEGAPAFSPDGKTLYFHQSTPGENRRQLMALDLKNPLTPPQKLDTKGDAAFPSPSPDGTMCTFVSLRDDPGGDIFLLSLDTGEVTALTRGPDRDLSPKWSRDGKHIYFTRLSQDRQAASNAAETPNPMILRIKAAEKKTPAYPVTSGTYSAFYPMPTADRLYFLSTQKGAGNIWSLPLGGDIPLLKDGKSQLALAETLSSRIPLDVPLAISAFYRVLETASGDGILRTMAAYRIGRLYEQTGEQEKAIEAYDLA
ncbi:MAG: hypothetical protein MUP26_01475, partial [Desulfobulbaceae bacterium]|nr:hypothetical protein [Desulfobulbaceae bacterium]